MKSPKYIKAIVVVLFSASLLSPVACAQTKTEVRWMELAQALDGRVVDTVLLDGTALRGRIIDVTESELRFQVKTTSKPAAYPKGEIAVPRGQVKVFSYSYRNGSRGRALGALIGGAAGAVPLIFAGQIANNEGSGIKGNVAGALVGVAAGGAALGYGLGHAADTKTMTVFIVDPVE